jgi:hypothetical protein
MYSIFSISHSIFKSYHLQRNNNSIKLRSLEALAAQVRHLYPDLVLLLKNLSWNAQLAMSAGHSIPQIQDTVTQVREALLLKPTLENFIQLA